MIKDFKEYKCYLRDMTIPSDKNISAREFDKLSKYKDLEIEITRMWYLKTTTIWIVMGALEMILFVGWSGFIAYQCL